MKYQANDFLKLRSLILKNSIFNSLLVAYLLNTHTPVVVGKSLIRLEGKLRRLVKERKGEKAKLPKYIIADIVVTLGLSFSIYYSYQDYPLIFIKNISVSGKSRVNALKNLSKTMFATYPFHASKADSIFSRQPKSLAILLEHSKISANFWKAGFSKKLREVSADDIYEEELDSYYKALISRLNDWRIFNNILIKLTIDGRLEIDNPKVGKLVAEKTVLNNRISVTFSDFRENTHLSTIAHYGDLSPTNWEKLNHDIDIFTLRRVFTTS